MSGLYLVSCGVMQWFGGDTMVGGDSRPGLLWQEIMQLFSQVGQVWCVPLPVDCSGVLHKGRIDMDQCEMRSCPLLSTHQ